ncbi:HD domain-containing protein [[Eubacterium] cellulosolvens]
MENEELLELFQKVGQLKNIKRSGWLRVGISNPESVADHSFRTAFIGMLLGDSLKLNTEKVMKLALLHDIPETVIGDITPYDQLSLAEKRANETKAMQELFKNAPDQTEYLVLWDEYNQGSSPEARFVKNIDKLEMALQAAEYHELYPELDLNEFLKDAEKQTYLNKLRELFDLIRMKLD